MIDYVIIGLTIVAIFSYFIRSNKCEPAKIEPPDRYKLQDKCVTISLYLGGADDYIDGLFRFGHRRVFVEGFEEYVIYEGEFHKDVSDGLKQYILDYIDIVYQKALNVKEQQELDRKQKLNNQIKKALNI